MLLSLPYLHDTIKLASPKFPKPVITFLIANVFTSAIKNVMTGLKGFWGYRGTLIDITKDNIVCESITILIPRLNPLVLIQHLAKVSP